MQAGLTRKAAAASTPSRSPTMLRLRGPRRAIRPRTASFGQARRDDRRQPPAVVGQVDDPPRLGSLAGHKKWLRYVLMTRFPRWNDVRADLVANAGGEEALTEARRRIQAYIDGHRLAERR
ncbi:hypothetical protein FAIPA1_230078 [Frankia sp. AiPs1]